MATKYIKKDQYSPNTFWMIREKVTGLFFTGKRWSTFKRVGKVYNTHRALVMALNRFFRRTPEVLNKIEIVEFKRVEVAVCEANGYGE